VRVGAIHHEKEEVTHATAIPSGLRAAAGWGGREVVEHAGSHCFICFCCEGEVAGSRDSANQHLPFYAYHDTRTGGLIAECHLLEREFGWRDSLEAFRETRGAGCVLGCVW
jgi:hypothetical protein